MMETMANPPIAAVICTPASFGSSDKHTMAKAPAHLLSHANGWCGKQLTSLCIPSRWISCHGIRSRLALLFARANRIAVSIFRYGEQGCTKLTRRPK